MRLYRSLVRVVLQSLLLYRRKRGRGEKANAELMKLAWPSCWCGGDKDALADGREREREGGRDREREHWGGACDTGGGSEEAGGRAEAGGRD